MGSSHRSPFPLDTSSPIGIHKSVLAFFDRTDWRDSVRPSGLTEFKIWWTRDPWFLPLHPAHSQPHSTLPPPLFDAVNMLSNMFIATCASTKDRPWCQFCLGFGLQTGGIFYFRTYLSSYNTTMALIVLKQGQLLFLPSLFPSKIIWNAVEL